MAVVDAALARGEFANAAAAKIILIVGMLTTARERQT
jgi:hypothetical protein